MAEKKESKKTRQLEERLVKEQARCWDGFNSQEKNHVFSYAEDYRDFLNQARTERKAVQVLVEGATGNGFRDLSTDLNKVSRLFQVSRGKFLAIAVLGKKPMTDGVRIITSHVDSPRLDLKPNPLYEDSGLAFLKTHYYGGIKKYHWVARSLALCGTVIRSDGSSVYVEIGFLPGEPVLTIPDLLPHLSRKLMDQKASEFIPGENLNLVVGSIPYEDKEARDRVKLAILELLDRKYKIKEEDFIGAELQIVPAEPARDAGLDSSFIAGYGQDDRVCAYTSFTALMETKVPEHCAIAVFYDKEEIGSEGNTSAKSLALEMFLMDLMAKVGIEPTTRNLHLCYFNSKALSADVTAALDPTYSDVYEKRNCAKLGHGINLTKYTGHGGKFMASEANAEYASWVRKLFNDNAIVWQAGDLGKVDEGGGGTVAKYLANSGIEIIDCGPAVLGMHSPLEVSAKDDIWMCHKAFKVFFAS
jgi:aspartyl aminopeptidase